MIKKLQETIRYIRREYPYTFTLGTAGAIAGGAMGAAIVTATGGLPLIVVIPAVAAGGTGAAMGRLNDSVFASETTALNGCRLIGQKKQIRQIRKTQELIDHYTAKYRHLDALPPKVQKKIMAHITDVTPTIAQMRIYALDSKKGGTAQEFSFTREAYDEAGGKVRLPVARIVLAAPKAAGRPPAPVLEASAAPQKKGGLRALFGKKSAPKAEAAPEPAPEPKPDQSAQMESEIRELRARLDRMEKPAANDLPKPRLNKPKFKE